MKTGYHDKIAGDVGGEEAEAQKSNDVDHAGDDAEQSWESLSNLAVSTGSFNRQGQGSSVLDSRLLKTSTALQRRQGYR